MRTKWLPIILTAIVLCSVYSTSREALIPFNASKERSNLLLTGDEPEYLLAAYSLAHDGDMNLHNNEQNQSWLAFQDQTVCGLFHGNIDYFRRVSPAMNNVPDEKWGDSQRLVHRPGLSVLIAPATWSTKRIRWWSYFIVSSFAIICLIIILYHAEKIGINIGEASVLSGLLLLSPPAFFYANQDFPEIPSAMILSLAIILLIRNTSLSTIFASLCIVIVPWFSDRTIPAAGALALACIYDRQKRKDFYIVLSIFFIGGALLLLYYFSRFHMPFPINHSPRDKLSITMAPAGLVRILFDRGNGLLWICPPLIILPAACIKWWQSRYRRKICIFTSLGILGTLLLIASFPDWGGGVCPAGRYFVIIQLMALPAFLVCLRQEITKWQKTFIILPFIVAIFISIILLPHPNWWYREYHPLFAHPRIQPFYRFLPRLKEFSMPNVLKTLAWLFAFVLYNMAILFEHRIKLTMGVEKS